MLLIVPHTTRQIEMVMDVRSVKYFAVSGVVSRAFLYLSAQPQ